MEPLHIEATKSTPAIFFREDTHAIEIAGESYPENAAAFFGPVFSWFTRFWEEDSSRYLVVDIALMYFNSSSSKILMNLFDMFEDQVADGWRICVNWHYHEDNDTVLECGEELLEDYDGFEFNLVRIADGND